MIVKPFGIYEGLFDPHKPVTICFWGIDRFGFAMGFSQALGQGKFFGGLFHNRKVRPLEWFGGNIEFGDLTRQKFIECFQKVYGIDPILEPWKTFVRPPKCGGCGVSMMKER